MKNLRDKFILTLLGALLFTSCHSTPSFDFGAYSGAERLFEKGKYEEAIVKYQEYLRESPGGNMAVISQYYLAKSHDALGHQEEARELYEKIVKEHPDLVWAGFSKTRLAEFQQENA